MHYNDFLEEHKKYSKYDSPDFEKLYDFINEAKSIYRMIEFTEKEKPALAGISSEMEERFKDRLDFNENFFRQAIGTMIKEAIKDFGYKVDSRKRMPTKETSFFTNASTYKYDQDNAVKKVKKVFVIEDI